jgi:hypothetical protein
MTSAVHFQGDEIHRSDNFGMVIHDHIFSYKH